MIEVDVGGAGTVDDGTGAREVDVDDEAVAIELVDEEEDDEEADAEDVVAAVDESDELHDVSTKTDADTDNTNARVFTGSF